MIIFGWRDRSHLAVGNAINCPVCQSIQQSVDVQSRVWFTLFFVPIFPMGQQRRISQCGACGTTFQEETLSAIESPDAHPIVATLVSSAGSQAPAQTHMRASKDSSWSLASLILGLASPLMVLACFASLATSIAAIISGHLGLREIARSGGMVRGHGKAITGLAFGYGSLVLTLGLMGFVYFVASRALDQSIASGSTSPMSQTAIASERMKHAEFLVMSTKDGKYSFGNTPEAERMARDFSDTIKQTHETLFESKRKRVIQLSQGQFVTYCELHDHICGFLVHVPGYRDHDNEAKEALSEIAWLTAVSTVREHLDPGDELIVGLKGTLMFGSVMQGRVPDDDESARFELVKSDALLRAFSIPNDAEVESLDIATPVQSASPYADVQRSESPELAFQPSAVTGTARASTFQIDPLEATAREPEMIPPNIMPASPTPASSTVAANMPSPVATSPRSTRTQAPPPAFVNKIDVRLVATIPKSGWNIRSLCFSADGKRLWLGRLDSTIDCYDLASTQLLFKSDRLDDLGQVLSLDLSNDSAILFAGGASGLTRSFRIRESSGLEALQDLYRHTRNVERLVASPSYSFVISGGQDGTIAWQTYGSESSSLRLLQTLKRSIIALHLPRTGVDAMATDGRTLLRFSLKTAEETSRTEISRSSGRAAAFSHDGSTLALSDSRTVTLFETSNGRAIEEFDYRDQGTQHGLLFHPEQNWLISGGRGVVTVRSWSDGEILAQLDLNTPLNISTMVLSPDAKSLAVVPDAAGQDVSIFQFENL